MPSNKTLKPTLGFFSLTNIVVANMIGAGIFTTSGLLMEELGNPLLMIGLWFIGGLVAFAGAMSYGELGATYPEAGGEYVFLSKLFHPSLGFLSGWVSFIVGFSAPIAASAIGISEYLTRTIALEIPDLQVQVIKKSISVFIILLFTVVHVRGMKLGSRFQDVLTVLKVLLIVVLIFIGFIWGDGDWSHFFVNEDRAGAQVNFKSIGLSLMWIMFAYSGWNASTYVGGEVKNPLKNLSRSLLVGTSVVASLYLLLNVLFVYALSPSDMSGVISIGGLTVNKLFGQSLDRVYSGFIAFALLSSLSAFIIIGPRVYYAMAKKGHFFRVASKINKHDVPAMSIVGQSILAIIFAVTGTFDQILTILGFSLGVFPILNIAGVIKLRKQKASKLKLPGYPFIQVFFIAMSLAFLVLAFLERPAESSIAIGIIVIGIPLYFWFVRGRRKEG
jgi:basic amino acid/polyamine antiporter, APA family